MNKIKVDKINVVCIVMAFVMMSAVLFIFANSTKTAEKSKQSSSKIVDEVKPIVDPENKVNRSDFHKLVRKTAHFTEFFVLGAVSWALCMALSAKKRRNFRYLPFVMTAVTAVMDEFLQTFNDGRSGMISDVFIDLSGAVAGILVFTALWAGYKKIKKSL